MAPARIEKKGDLMLISGSTKVFALFGDPVTHSLSPIMQNAAFRALQLDCCYVSFLVRQDGLAVAVKAVRELNLGGVNITIPHKERVLAYLDQVDERALQIGAVNTIVNQDGHLCGYNTDASGFLASLGSVGFETKGKRVVMMGAGGAARAVAVALVHAGASRIDISNRSLNRAESLADDLRKIGADVDVCDYGVCFFEAVQNADLLVNATPVGMYPNHEDAPLIMRDRLPPHLLVCDLVYNPPQTRLLKEAAAAGCSVINGVGTLVHQGALAFELWTGRKAPLDLLQIAVDTRGRFSCVNPDQTRDRRRDR
ncbi:MAG: shikimate dehydrogenase [Syntrophaceticus sp.]|nr:shikimate dehydrogenase [Syntrophaceticus sp.]MDD3315014.1 shikimate dehydrogenase [Syntrophaceticus sp.]